MLFCKTRHSDDIGLLILRVGIGLIFIFHGYPKLMGGQEKWIWLGNQMVYVGITFWPAFWGLMCAIAEFFGGIALILGLCTRVASFLLAFNMIIALIYHYHDQPTWPLMAHPLSLLVVFCALFFAGAGKYSVDHFLCNHAREQ